MNEWIMWKHNKEENPQALWPHLIN